MWTSCRRNSGSRCFNLELPVATILLDPAEDWRKLKHGKSRIAADRNLSVDWKKFNQEDNLFVHSTIVSSVDVASNGYYINPPCDQLVNTNGNAWSTPVLLATFRSFVGKNNYFEHIQIPALSKGKILDAVARPIRFAGKDGKDADVLYVDILVAVDRKHSDIVKRIEDGELNAMSMGCLAHVVQCSKCGKEFTDEMPACNHIQNELLTYFTDDKGNRRIVAELCGRCIKDENGNLVGDPNSLEFIEENQSETTNLVEKATKFYQKGKFGECAKVFRQLARTTKEL